MGSFGCTSGMGMPKVYRRCLIATTVFSASSATLYDARLRIPLRRFRSDEVSTQGGISASSLVAAGPSGATCSGRRTPPRPISQRMYLDTANSDARTSSQTKWYRAFLRGCSSRGSSQRKSRTARVTSKPSVLQCCRILLVTYTLARPGR